MPRLCDSSVDKIVKMCINLYENLPKTGKPIQKEWTVLSCIVQHNTEIETSEVVSLGTGSKCIGATKMSSQGNILNDSHAEIFARRGFLLYLYEQLIYAIQNQESIFLKDGYRFKLKDNVEFVFYSSQMPCGDASIILKSGDTDDIGNIILSSKRKSQDDICDLANKKNKLDIHRTGAKCLSQNEQDSKEAGCLYHLVGQVRTKPGRGDRTLSVSCSDKMARWIHVGVQGGLLNLLLCQPVFFNHFIFGSGVPFSEETLCRALLHRQSDVAIADILKEIPELYRSSLIFPHIRTHENLRPASSSIVWVKTKNRSLEVAVQGKKLGVTKKKANDLSNSISISKYNIYKKFLEVLCKMNDLKDQICGEESLYNIPYNEMKIKSVQYQTDWNKIKEIFFKSWTLKPDIWNFCVNKVK